MCSEDKERGPMAPFLTVRLVASVLVPLAVVLHYCTAFLTSPTHVLIPVLIHLLAIGSYLNRSGVRSIRLVSAGQ